MVTNGSGGVEGRGRGAGAWLYKDNVRGPYGDGRACILTIKVNILVVMVYYSFVRRYHERKLGKGYVDSLCYFLQLHVIYNYLKRKSLIRVKRTEMSLSPENDRCGFCTALLRASPQGTQMGHTVYARECLSIEVAPE